MDAEKTMEFILEQQAHFEADFAKAELRSALPEKCLDPIGRQTAQENHLVAGLAGHGVALRPDIRRHQKSIAADHKRAEGALARAEGAGAPAEAGHEKARKESAEAEARRKALSATGDRYLRRSGN